MLADATCEGARPAVRAPLLVRQLTYRAHASDRRANEDVVVKGPPGRPDHAAGNARDGQEGRRGRGVPKGDRCVYDFLYVAPVDQFEAGRAEFQAFVRAWRWARTVPADGMGRDDQPRTARESVVWYGGLGLLTAQVARNLALPPSYFSWWRADRHHRRAFGDGGAHRRAVHRHGARAPDRGEHGTLRAPRTTWGRWWRCPSCASWARADRRSWWAARSPRASPPSWAP